jgi:hypothetical protein
LCKFVDPVPLEIPPHTIPLIYSSEVVISLQFESMAVYKSKIGPELAIPVGIALFTGLVLASAAKNWIAVAIDFAAMVFVLHVFITTYYEIRGKLLRVKCGFLIDKEIEIDSIVSLKETYNPLSAPAVSIDRIEIKLAAGKDSILVSPADKKGFINDLLAVKPGIRVTLRRRKG